MGSRFFFSLALLSLPGLESRAHALDSVEEIFQKASAALQSQDYAGAEAGFRAVLKAEPRNVGALGNLGVLYSRTRRYAASIEAYEKALRIAPGDKVLLTNLGLAYVKQEQFRSARAIFEPLARDRSNLQAQELLATCDLSLGDYGKANDLLSYLRSAEPGNPAILYMAGVALTRLDRKQEAHEAFLQMMNAATPAQANFLMGKASYETGDFEAAAEFFRKTLEADSRFDGAHRELGKTLVSLHQQDAAIAELRLAKPDDGEAIYFLGAALANTQPQEAIPLLQRARDLTPDFWGPAYYLGRIAAEQGRTADAVSLLERAAKLKPNESAIHYQLAKVYQVMGRRAEARSEFDRVKVLKEQGLQKEVNVLSPGAGKAK